MLSRMGDMWNAWRNLCNFECHERFDLFHLISIDFQIKWSKFGPISGTSA